MNDNQINKINSDSNFDVQYETHQTFQDNDSDSSILNLLDMGLLDEISEEIHSPHYYMTEHTNSKDRRCPPKPLAASSITRDSTNAQFEDLVLSQLPHVSTVYKPVMHYEILDQNYPSLSNSFKICFPSPVLNLLVVVLNAEKSVSFYQGYFAGLSRLASEIIDLKGKYWNTLISNNDENIWENHYQSVTDKFNSSNTIEPEFQNGPVIRCRLSVSTNNQLNHQFNYFFVQPCSYMVRFPHVHRRFNLNDIDHQRDIQENNVYMISFINVIRQCDTEDSLTESDTCMFENVFANVKTIYEDDSNPWTDIPQMQTFVNNCKRPVNRNSAQLSVEVSTPASYNNCAKSMPIAPMTYPFIHDQQYYSQRPPIQTQQCVPQAMLDNQYMPRGMPVNNLEHYGPHYQMPQSSPTLQYLITNRNVQYPNQANQIPTHHNNNNNIAYQTNGRNNAPCYSQVQMTPPSNCSHSSSTNFLPMRHHGQLSSNGMILSSDQYFRNGRPMDSLPDGHPTMNAMRSKPPICNQNINNFYGNTTPSQQQQPIHVNNSLSYQNQFSNSNLPQYLNKNNNVINNASSNGMASYCTPPYHMNPLPNNMIAKQESDNLASSQQNWHINDINDDSISKSYSNTMIANDSISFDIVEEILKAEEAKSENKQKDKSQSNSDNSDSLSFDFEEFGLPDQGSQAQQTNTTTDDVVSNNTVSITSQNKPTNTKYSSEYAESTDDLVNLKSATLEKFTKAQRLALQNIVEQYKAGKFSKKQMLLRINDFVTQTFGKSDHYRHVIDFWKTQHHNNSTLSNFDCSYIVQSPEEGPGISPTEQAAQSTTDMEEDRSLGRNISKHTPINYKNECIADQASQRNRSRSGTKAVDSSIYSITSTTSTGVLETLLNEHDVADKSYVNNFSAKLSVPSTPKRQLSLDQLLMDDECLTLSGFSPSNQNDKIIKKSMETTMRQLSSNSHKSQPPTTSASSNIGVLESLLNQKNPSQCRIRQKSTESILKHSKPSRQNSVEIFHDDSSEIYDKDSGTKNNSLLITLLNNCNGTSSTDKVISENVSSHNFDNDGIYGSQSKKQRTMSGLNFQKNENNFHCKLKNEKCDVSDVDVFEFVDYEVQNHNLEVLSSPSFPWQTSVTNNKCTRKRCHSKEMSLDSDPDNNGSDRLSTNHDKPTYNSTPLSSSSSSFSWSAMASDRKIIQTASLLDNQKLENTIISPVITDSCSTIDRHGRNSVTTTSTKTNNNETTMYDNNVVNFDDIKIDDFDLDHMMDVPPPRTESTRSSAVDEASIVTGSLGSVPSNPVMYTGTYPASSCDVHNVSVVYTMAPPVTNISQSEHIVTLSKPSLVRVTDKNSILFPAMQSIPSTSIITVESLDNERERLLKQQQQQKMCMGGKYVSLNHLDPNEVDSPCVKINHPLSLNLLSKQMKEVVPNVVVEQSIGAESSIHRKSSFSQVLPTNLPLSSSNARVAPCDTQIEISKQCSQVNHQQVKEGLRLLVSNRSAHNTSKNSCSSVQQRASVMCPHEFMNPPGPDSSHVNRSSASMGLIHYHSDPQVTVNHHQPDKSTAAIAHGAEVATNEMKTANILEDSLVNDVFELEELVKSNTSNTCLDPLTSSDLSPHDPTLNSQQVPPPSELNSLPMPILSTKMTTGRLHHHHRLHHYRHFHPTNYHHHHPISDPQTTNGSSVSIAKDKQNVPSNTGLLETLLSR